MCGDEAEACPMMRYSDSAAVPEADFTLVEMERSGTAQYTRATLIGAGVSKKFKDDDEVLRYFDGVWAGWPGCVRDD